jgi:hypothetical protein
VREDLKVEGVIVGRRGEREVNVLKLLAGWVLWEGRKVPLRGGLEGSLETLRDG